MPAGASTDFLADCRDAVGRLRATLLELYRSVDADPAQPQDVARRLKLNKNLTWKTAKVIQTEDAFEAAALLPGSGGLDILFDGFAAGGAPDEVVTRVREAAREFERMIDIHLGDRATLELVLDSMGPDKLERSRKLAFRGNSGIRGVQVKTRVTAHFMAPNPSDPARLDLAMVGGVVRVRRLRPGPIGPVFELTSYDGAGEAEPATARRAIEETGEEPWLLRSFCDGQIPEITPVRTRLGLSYQMGETPVGKTGEFTCFFGLSDPAMVPRYRDERDQTGELTSSVTLPAETHMFDLFVHRDLTEALRPEVNLYGQVWINVMAGLDPNPLPLTERLVELGRGAAVSTPHVPRYAEIVDAVEKRCGWRHQDFHCLRFVMEHPPMPSTVVMRFPLAEAPGP